MNQSIGSKAADGEEKGLTRREGFEIQNECLCDSSTPSKAEYRVVGLILFAHAIEARFFSEMLRNFAQ